MLDWADIARVLSQAPASIGQLEGYDAPLAIGAPAHLTLVDPAATRTWSTTDLRGRSSNTPYTGRELPGRVMATGHAGTITVSEGDLVDTAVLGTTERG